MARLIAILALFASVAHAETPRNWYVASGTQPGVRKLLYFSASWCGPCKDAKRNLYALPESVKFQKYNIAGNSCDVVMVDLDENPEAAEAFGVNAVPTFVLCETTASGELRKIRSHTGVLSTGQIQAMLMPPTISAASANWSVRDDICTCGCSRRGCRCQFNQGARR